MKHCEVARLRDDLAEARARLAALASTAQEGASLWAEIRREISELRGERQKWREESARADGTVPAREIELCAEIVRLRALVENSGENEIRACASRDELRYELGAMRRARDAALRECKALRDTSAQSAAAEVKP